MRKYVELFKGLMEGVISVGGGGYIIGLRFNPRYNYGIFEIIGFKNVKNIHMGDSGVTFHADGYKCFILYEPVNYPKRFMEPYLREDIDQIPMRWTEVHTVDMPNRDRVIINKDPFISQGSFVVESPDEGNFVYHVFEAPQMDLYAEEFVAKVLKDDFKVARSSMEKILAPVRANLKRFQREAED